MHVCVCVCIHSEEATVQIDSAYAFNYPSPISLMREMCSGKKIKQGAWVHRQGVLRDTVV